MFSRVLIPQLTEIEIMLKKRFFKTKEECEVAFEVDATDAVQIELICEANGWQPIEMKKTKGGAFRTRVRLPKEREFQFRYLVDGKAWLNDDDADSYLVNEFGIENCVLSTTPAK
jgi:1,4-alpha-glucan branching enzyme